MSQAIDSADSRHPAVVAVEAEKAGPDVEVLNLDAHDIDTYLYAENGEQSHSTSADIRHMQRLGRNQQLVRNFRFFSMTSFVAVATAAWEFSLFLITPALIDGGIPNLLYNAIWCFVIFIPIYLSMAEMASMAPIAGSQYHWVSEFAPEKYQRILSYLTGWSSTLAWQAGNAIGVFLAGSLIQALITINYPEYDAPAWQGTLLVIGVIIISFVGTVYGSKIMHHWQNAMFVFHIAAFLAFVIPVWVKAPSISHREVWLDFENTGGWSTMTLSIMVGQFTGISSQVGIDTAAHMSEEVKDAGRQIPRIMICVFIINFAVIMPTMITAAYHIPSVEDALADPTFYPGIYVLRQVGSTAYTNIILVSCIIILIAGDITYLTAVTRDLFAFARDQGLPLSGWIARVDPKRAIPVNAVLVSSLVATALSLIYIGSPVAFYAICSAIIVALLQCYCFSIGCVLWRRIYHPDTLPPAAFSLGRWGVPTNALAVLSSLWCFFWSFWPQTAGPSAAEFNWSSVLFVATLIIAMVHFVFQGRKTYHGPVTLVEGRKTRSA